VRPVQPVYLFDLAFQRAEWLSTRQTAVAENVVNANTPNYRAREVEPFEATLDRTALALSATDPRHIEFAPPATHASAFGGKIAARSGNDVSIEKELIKAGEVSRDYALNVSVVKTFHRMWMASLKG
jgi:flagellar basal-body rod protein FlgB